MFRIFAAIAILALIAWVQVVTVTPAGVQEMAMADPTE